MSIVEVPSTTPVASERQARVLIVDDVAVNLVLLRRALESRYEIEEAASGEQALDACARSRPDLVLLDVRMPGIDGYEVLRRLRAGSETHDLPVVLVTADASEAGEVTGLELGADDYISKPIVLPVVLARIRALLIRQNLKRDMLRLERDAVRLELDAARASASAALAQGAQNERLASLGRLVASFAHDIGNPIGNCRVLSTTIEEQAQALGQGLESRRLQRSELVSFIDESGRAAQLLSINLERASELLNRFKSMALDSATSQRRRIKLAEWLDQLLYSMSPLLKTQPIQVAVDVSGEPSIETVPGALAQVVSNLVTNAFVHAYEGRSTGTVTIRASLISPDVLFLSVSDDGCGIEPEVLPQVFDPFFTTKADRGGTGLGLDIVSKIVRDTLAGTITVKSEIGVGTSFDIELPAGPIVPDESCVK